MSTTIDEPTVRDEYGDLTPSILIEKNVSLIGPILDPSK